VITFASGFTGFIPAEVGGTTVYIPYWVA